MKTVPFSLVAVTLAIAGIFAATLGDQVSRASIAMQVDHLGEQCDAGIVAACERLVLVTGGQCAGPQGSGCRYELGVKGRD